MVSGCAAQQQRAAAAAGGGGRAAAQEEVVLLGDGAGRGPEEALAQMTAGLHALGMLAMAGGAGPADEALKKDAGLRRALEAGLKEVASSLDGRLVSLGDDGKLSVDLGPMIAAALGRDSSLVGGASQEPLSLDITRALLRGGGGGGGDDARSEAAGSSGDAGAEDLLRQRVKALQGAMQGAADEDSALLAAAKDASSPLVNELLLPGARIAERLNQLGEIAVDQPVYPIKCGDWQWSPGGARTRPRWVGPSFTLSTALGSCALLTPGVIGQGATSWTSVQLARLACQGPSLQYGFTPLSYIGPSREPELLVGPECKVERRYGTETSFTLFGGPIDRPIRFESEAEFYAAMIVNKTFDFRMMEIKTFLQNTQSRIDDGSLRLGDLLGLGGGGGGGEGGKGGKGGKGGMVDAFEELLRGSGQISQKIGGAVKGGRAQVLSQLERRLGEDKGRGGLGGSAAWLKALVDRVAKGKSVMRGPDAASAAT
ncbi:MAG: hypothetical protein J3K34DRAFT_484339 [Monoraphidium minutum]|nr:MAG: hypothetical protein J3K34DRAFT_484339 [Monoraphidium minutum]